MAILVSNALSAALSYTPLSVIALVAMQVKANLIGPPEHIIDEGEDGLSMMVFYLLSALVLLAFTVLPAVIGNLVLRRRAGWTSRVCLVVAIAMILAPIIAAFVVPKTMNEIWYESTNWW